MRWVENREYEIEEVKEKVAVKERDELE